VVFALLSAVYRLLKRNLSVGNHCLVSEKGCIA
jgi:hypothetical protein